MLRFRLGNMTGTFEDGVLTISDDGNLSGAFERTAQAMIDYDIEFHDGYLPGLDASARRILLGMGATITYEEAEYDPDKVY